ncbi:MAG: hypothetical protein NUV72_08265 [Bauldia sp.]|nr:hypothetical protein [Bauldia sp.]
MNEILLILHFFGLGAGFASSIGNFTVMQLIQASPGDAPVLGKVPPVLARVGQVGLGLLWVTGLIMVWSRYGGPGNLDWAFWLKIVCVILLTGLAIFLDLTVKRVRAGDMAAAAQLPLFGRIGAGLLVLIVIFAVIAFH